MNTVTSTVNTKNLVDTAAANGSFKTFGKAIERAGMSGLNEGQKVTFDVVADRRTGKSAAENLRAA